MSHYGSTERRPPFNLIVTSKTHPYLPTYLLPSYSFFPSKPPQTLLQQPQQLPLPPLPTPTPLNRIPPYPSPLLHPEPKRLLHRAVIAQYITPDPIHLLPRPLIHIGRRDPKIRRVVRIDTKPHAGVEIRADREGGDRGCCAERQIGDGADCNQCPRLYKVAQELGVVEESDPVVDPLHL